MVNYLTLHIINSLPSNCIHYEILCMTAKLDVGVDFTRKLCSSCMFSPRRFLRISMFQYLRWNVLVELYILWGCFSWTPTGYQAFWFLWLLAGTRFGLVSKFSIHIYIKLGTYSLSVNTYNQVSQFHSSMQPSLEAPWPILFQRFAWYVVAQGAAWFRHIGHE